MLIDLPAPTTSSLVAQSITLPPSSAAASSQDSSSDPPQTSPAALPGHSSLNPTSASISTSLHLTLSNSTNAPGDQTSSPSTSLVYATNTGGSNASDSGNALSSNQPSSNGLAQSDHIALGVGIGVGLPGTIATMVGAYYGWKACKRIIHHSNKDDPGAG